MKKLLRHPNFSLLGWTILIVSLVASGVILSQALDWTYSGGMKVDWKLLPWGIVTAAVAAVFYILVRQSISMIENDLNSDD